VNEKWKKKRQQEGTRIWELVSGLGDMDYALASHLSFIIDQREGICVPESLF